MEPSDRNDRREVTVSNWWTRADEIEETTWRRSDLQVGDLIFCANRGGLLTQVGAIAGERWRHVGSIMMRNGEMHVVENVGPQFEHRKLDDFFAKYDTFGAARLGVDPDCIAAANAWMSARADAEGDNVAYAFDDFVLAGLIALTRRGLLASHPDRVRAAIQAGADACKQHLARNGQSSLTCSAFIQLAYEDAGGGCALRHRTWRSGDAVWPARAATLDELLAPDADLSGYHDVSVLDILRAQERDGGPDRYFNREFRIAPDQLGEAARVIVAAVVGAARLDIPEVIEHDGRWVTPGDLWDSDTVVTRGPLLPD